MTHARMGLIVNSVGRLAVVLAVSICAYVIARRFVALSNSTADTLAAVIQAANNNKPSPVRPPSADEVNRLRALSDRVEVITDNLANVHTRGFKRRRIDATTDLQTQIGDLQFDMTQGRLETTGINTDVAIQGDGFFKVRIPSTVSDGFGYTRNGSLFQNEVGDLVIGSGHGYELMPLIHLPVGVTDIEIAQDGTVTYVPKGGDTHATAGQIAIYRFTSPQMLIPYRSGIYTQCVRSGSPIVNLPGQDGAGQIIEGALEASNVDPVHEWAELIKAEQSLQISSELIPVANKTLEMFVAMKQ